MKNLNELNNPIIVDFPLDGEWWVPTTPGTKIPSHGTDMLGQRYAYDFAMVDWAKNKKPYKGSNWRYYLLGMPLSQWHGWGQNIYAPCDGKIIVAKDGLRERQRLHILPDLFVVVIKNGLFFDSKKCDLHRIAGNHIVMQTDNAYAFFAHFQTGSICVTEGQEIKSGELLGRLGHSGNSTAPHLHFHLMDSADPLIGKGVPCAFKRYERFQDGSWEEVVNGIPTAQDRIRGNRAL